MQNINQYMKKYAVVMSDVIFIYRVKLREAPNLASTAAHVEKSLLMFE